MIYYIFKGNTSEINRHLMLQCSSLSDSCCPRKNNLRQGTVKTASSLTKPVKMTKTKYRNKLVPEADLRLQLSLIMLHIKLMHSSNSLVCHTEKLTYNVYCFIDWLNLQWSCIILFSYQKKKPTVYFFLLCLHYQLKNRGGVLWNISVWKIVPQTKVWKTLH
jgi:hypothetical protein